LTNGKETPPVNRDCQDKAVGQAQKQRLVSYHQETLVATHGLRYGPADVVEMDGATDGKTGAGQAHAQIRLQHELLGVTFQVFVGADGEKCDQC